MKVIRIRTDGRYTSHGIGYTEHDGYAGTSDNRLPIKSAIAAEMRCIMPGEEYQIEVNGVNKGTFRKQVQDRREKGDWRTYDGCEDWRQV